MVALQVARAGNQCNWLEPSSDRRHTGADFISARGPPPGPVSHLPYRVRKSAGDPKAKGPRDSIGSGNHAGRSHPVLGACCPRRFPFAPPFLHASGTNPEIDRHPTLPRRHAMTLTEPHPGQESPREVHSEGPADGSRGSRGTLSQLIVSTARAAARPARRVATERKPRHDDGTAGKVESTGVLSIWDSP